MRATRSLLQLLVEGPINILKRATNGAELIITTFLRSSGLKEFSVVDDLSFSATAWAAVDSTTILFQQPDLEGIARDHLDLSATWIQKLTR